MQNGSVLEERRCTQRRPWYSSRNSDVELRSVQLVRELELKRTENVMPTRDNSGERFASVLMMIESSAPAGDERRRDRILPAADGMQLSV